MWLAELIRILRSNCEIVMNEMIMKFIEKFKYLRSLILQQF